MGPRALPGPDVMGGRRRSARLSQAIISIALWLPACTRKEGPIQTNRRPLADGTRTQPTRAAYPEPRTAAAIPSSQVPVELQTFAWASSGSCNIERLGKEALAIRRGDILRLSGWALAEREQRAPARLFVVFDSRNEEARWYAAVAEFVPRPIARSGSASGFNIAVDSGPLPRGELRILLAFQDAGCPEICDSGRRIRVE